MSASHASANPEALFDWGALNFIMFVLVAVGVWPAIAMVIDMITGRPLVFETVAMVDPPAMRDPSLAEGVSGVYTGDAIFTVTDPSPLQWVAALLIPVVTAVVVAVSLLMVRRLARNLRAGDAFNPGSLLAVRVLGLVLFTYGLFRPLVELVMVALITTEMRSGQFGVAWRMDAAAGWPMAVGVVVGVVGEAVLGRGRELADEAEGLV